jgi:predicted dehydrogenase
MSLYLPPELKQKGRDNFQAAAAELTRRDFMKSMAFGAAGLGAVGAAFYFGYNNEEFKNNPVRTALIGAGDEGGVLVGEHNPDYLRFVAVCEIRPSNQERIFQGEDPKPDQTEADVVRKGFRRIEPYGKDCRKKIELVHSIPELLKPETIKRLGIEAVVIALPLHLHAPVAIQCLNAGLNVLCEKLMAWNVRQCKEMISAARKNDRVLSIGHQRHYSLLYAHATEVIKAGTLGDIKHIRALWHRNNAKPKHETLKMPESTMEDLKKADIPEELLAVLKRTQADRIVKDAIADGWKPDIKKADREALAAVIEQHGYKTLEELVRWRLYNATGGGLMAELGSHQLDACSIFLQAATQAVRGGDAPAKVLPLAVSGVGGKYFYRDDRDIDDHVFVTYEFPGPNYWDNPQRTRVKDPGDIVVVTYSSINTNSFEPYGECVMGTRATMVVEEEKEIQLYREKGWEATDSKGSSVAVTTNTGAPVVSSTSSSGPAERAGGSGPSVKVSRGYREEMEHFAYCIRMREKVSPAERVRYNVHCDGPSAMVDAILALAANRALRNHERIDFTQHMNWFDASPEALGDVPDEPDWDKKYLKAYPYGGA